MAQNDDFGSIFGAEFLGQLFVEGVFDIGVGIGYYWICQARILRKRVICTNIIMFGPPGAGKGTRAGMIREMYGIPHVSSGDLLRAEIKKGNDLGNAAKIFMDAGELVPDLFVFYLIEKRLKEEDCKNGVIFDGFPRNKMQCNWMERNGYSVDFVLNIPIGDEEVVERLGGRRACGNCGAIYHVVNIPPKVEGVCDECGSGLIIRDDDKPDVIRDRLKVYRAQTAPVLEELEKSYKISELSARNTAEAERQILEILGSPC